MPFLTLSFDFRSVMIIMQLCHMGKKTIVFLYMRNQFISAGPFSRCYFKISTKWNNNNDIQKKRKKWKKFWSSCVLVDSNLSVYILLSTPKNRKEILINSKFTRKIPKSVWKLIFLLISSLFHLQSTNSTIMKSVFLCVRLFFTHTLHHMMMFTLTDGIYTHLFCVFIITSASESKKNLIWDTKKSN